MKKIFLKIKNWFIKHSERIKKILILLSVFGFGCCCGSCLQVFRTNILTANAQTVSNSQFVSDGVICFDLGNIAQIRTVSGSPTVRYVSSALPTFITIDCSGDTDFVSFEVGIGSVDRSISSNSYTNLFSNYSFRFSNVSGASGNLNWIPTSTNISFSDNTYNLSYMHLFQYRGSFPYDEGGQFGYFYPDNIYYTTEGAFGTWYGSKPTEGVTYFIMGCNDTDINPTRIIKYNIQTVLLDNNISFGTGNLLLDRNFILHTFLCDNGGLYYFGYNTYSRVISTDTNYQFNHTYDFSSGDYNVGYSDGYEVGYNTGYDLGFNVGSTNQNETVYENGYNNGYIAGSQVALEDVNPFNAVLLFVDSFLNVKLFNTISLGTILSLVFGLVMVGIVIKVFLGG